MLRSMLAVILCQCILNAETLGYPKVRILGEGLDTISAVTIMSSWKTRRAISCPCCIHSGGSTKILVNMMIGIRSEFYEMHSD